MVSLTTILPELRIMMFEYLCDHCSSDWDSKIGTGHLSYISAKPLRMLCLVSRTIRVTAQPILFHFFLGYANQDDDYKAVQMFYQNVSQRPDLVSGLRSLSLPHANEDGWIVDEESGNGRGAWAHADWAECRQNRMVRRILKNLTQIQQLELCINIEVFPNPPWISNTSNLSTLRELNLHNSTFSGKLTSELVALLITNKPWLRKLTLTNYNEFDDSILTAVRDIKQFTVHYDLFSYRSTRSDLDDIGPLIEAMPQLENVELFEWDSDHWALPENFLRALICRKDALRSLTIRRQCLNKRLDLLQQFPNLENLDLRIPDPFVKIKFPKSLKHLIVRNNGEEHKNIRELLHELRRSLRQYPNLETVHAALHEPSWITSTSGNFDSTSKEELIQAFLYADVRLSIQKEAELPGGFSLRRNWGVNGYTRRPYEQTTAYLDSSSEEEEVDSEDDELEE